MEKAESPMRRNAAFGPIRGFTERRRNLPHFQDTGATYFVTFRTRHGEMPPEARSIALESCLFWNGKRVRVHACVVMPDHVHLLITPLPSATGPGSESLTAVLHSIKSYSANRINRALGICGCFWLDESFDRAIRSEEELWEKWSYIRDNPVKWELVEEPESYPFLYEES